MNQFSFLLRKIEQMPDAEIKSIVKEVTKLYVEATSVISQIIAEQDSKNKGTYQLPTVMAHEMVVMENSDFCAIVWQHFEHLLRAGVSLSFISLNRIINKALLPIINKRNPNQN